MNILRALFSALFSGLLLTACSFDESLELCRLSVLLTYEKASFEQPAAASVLVELRDTHGQVFADSTDAATRTVSFLVPPGIYEASTSSQYTDSTQATWWRYMFNGTKSLIIVSPDSLNQVEMSVRVSRKRVVH